MSAVTPAAAGGGLDSSVGTRIGLEDCHLRASQNSLALSGLLLACCVGTAVIGRSTLCGAWVPGSLPQSGCHPLAATLTAWLTPCSPAVDPFLLRR